MVSENNNKKQHISLLSMSVTVAAVQALVCSYFVIKFVKITEEEQSRLMQLDQMMLRQSDLLVDLKHRIDNLASKQN